VPYLRFHYVESLFRGAQLSALIERAVSEDRQHGDEPAEVKE
jgi:ribosome-binding factor A